jgi:hypothetical protein
MVEKQLPFKKKTIESKSILSQQDFSFLVKIFSQKDLRCLEFYKNFDSLDQYWLVLKFQEIIDTSCLDLQA